MSPAHTSPPPPCLLTFASGGDHVTIRISGWLFDDPDGAYDANALTGTVSLRVGAFGASYRAMFHTWDFVDLRQQVADLHAEGRGEASLHTRERQLELLLRGDERGHVNITGEASDDVEFGSTLRFHLTIEQASLARALDELDVLLRDYPMRGQRERASAHRH